VAHRYIVGPARSWRSEDGDFWQDRPTMTVFSEDDRPIATGLLDASGAPLFRVQERAPLGFVTKARND
jgi:hypothetical protein